MYPAASSPSHQILAFHLSLECIFFFFRFLISLLPCSLSWMIGLSIVDFLSFYCCVLSVRLHGTYILNHHTLSIELKQDIEAIRTQTGQPIYTVVLFIALGYWSAPKLKSLVPFLVENIHLFKALYLRSWNRDSWLFRVAKCSKRVGYCNHPCFQVPLIDDF